MDMTISSRTHKGDDTGNHTHTQAFSRHTQETTTRRKATLLIRSTDGKGNKKKSLRINGSYLGSNTVTQSIDFSKIEFSTHQSLVIVTTLVHCLSLSAFEMLPIMKHAEVDPHGFEGYLKMEVKHGDDLIDAINHVMSFLSAVVTSCYPTTNNQLRNSSNPRQQATINDGRVTIQPVQGRQISYAARVLQDFHSKSME
ncbi:hypothetical protein Tco_0204940 [Tanacetum coccineum]